MTKNADGFFRTAYDDAACGTCGHGATITIVYAAEDGEDIGIGISWDDDEDGREAAQNLLDELNFAYRLGFKHASEGDSRE